MKHETELQKQKDNEAYKREQLKARTALKNRVSGEGKSNNFMKEEWQTIKGTNDKYSVSNLGNVKRNEHYTIVSPTSQHPNGAKCSMKKRKLKDTQIKKDIEQYIYKHLIKNN